MGSQGEPNAPWRDANYALQILAGLMAPQDALTVVRMSEPGTPVAIDLRDQATRLVEIRERPHAGGGTPYSAVETAMRVLEQATDDEARRGAAPSEKWLIVITDGRFFDRQLDASMEQALRQSVRSFVQKTGARTVLLLIGGNVPEFAAIWEQEVQTRRYEALPTQIAEQMRHIAEDITSRSERPLPVRVQGNTATFTTQFPLRRITVLQQQNQPASLAGLRGAQVGTEALPLPGALEPAMPDNSGTPVFGRIHHLQGARPGAVIPAGTVTLTFDRPVTSNDLQVFPEVAARLDAWLADARGNPLRGSGTQQVCTDERLRIRATLVSPAGDTLLRKVQDPTQFRVVAQYGTQPIPLRPAPGGAFFEALVPPQSGDATVSVSASYPGYFNYRSRIFTIHPVVCRHRVLGFLPVRPWSARVTDLHRAPWVELIPTADGVPIPPAELERWSLRRVDDGKLRVDIERTPRGWRVRPRKTHGLACFTPTGRIPVQFEASSGSPGEKSVSRTDEFNVEDVSFWKKCGWLILLLLLLILLAFYIFRLLRKRRFCRGSEIVHQRITLLATNRAQTEGLPGRSWLARWLLPTRAERKASWGVTFEAGHRCSYILLPPEAQADNMYVAGERIEEPGRRAVRIANGDTLEIRTGSARERYTYSHRT